MKRALAPTAHAPHLGPPPPHANPNHAAHLLPHANHNAMHIMVNHQALF